MRDWSKANWLVAGQRVWGWKSVCQCGAETSLLGANMGRGVACEQVPKKFRQRGWFIGLKPEEDRCPACMGRAKAEKVGLRSRPRFVPKVVKAEQVVEQQEAQPPALPDMEVVMTVPNNVSELPRKPTREQRRRVMDALDEAYPQAEKGYREGQSDEAVAKRLDVPRAWVSELREQLYGPEFVVDVGQYERRLAALEQTVKAVEDRALKDLDEVTKMVRQARAELEAVRKRVAA